jgi:acyl-coenzyme A synthetase/AMP-(fatty) acid ligase
MSASTAIRFATSGYTGQQKSWFRSETQLCAEAKLIGDLIVGPVDEIVSFAPPQHLFGALFGEVLPRLLDVPVQFMYRDPCAVPVLRPGRRVLFVCLPSAWLMLRRLTATIRDLPGAVFLHGTGPTTPAAEQTVAELRGGRVRAVELFGSTETGGIGYRDLCPGESGSPWTLLPDVELLEDPGADIFGPGTRRLHVRSSRLARPQGEAEPPSGVLLEDVVRLLDERRFIFLGRSSRLIKVNGKRCDLDEVEKWIHRSIGTAVACLPVRDLVRGEHYELFYTADGVRGNAEVWQRLAGLAGTVPLPRKLHAVGAIPMTSTGKIKVDQLYACVDAQVKVEDR